VRVRRAVANPEGANPAMAPFSLPIEFSPSNEGINVILWKTY